MKLIKLNETKQKRLIGNAELSMMFDLVVNTFEAKGALDVFETDQSSALYIDVMLEA